MRIFHFFRHSRQCHNLRIFIQNTVFFMTRGGGIERKRKGGWGRGIRGREDGSLSLHFLPFPLSLSISSHFPTWEKFPHFPFFSSFQSGTASLKILAELDWVKILVCASSLSVSWLRAQWNMECFEDKKRDYVMTEANKYREVGGIRMGGGSLCYLFQPVCIQRS